MAHSRTIISLPHNHKENSTQHKSENDAVLKRHRNYISLQERMIAGVLYSVSRNLLGEIFPIYVGKNTIGVDKHCDICLRENSIYDSHAVILVRKLIDDNGNPYTTVSISPDSPGAVIDVNGLSSDYDRIYCNNGDIIKIGDNYKLSLHLLSPEISGISESVEFHSIFDNSDEDVDFEINMISYNRPSEIYRDSISEDDEKSFYAPSKPKETDHLSTKTIVDNQ